MDTPVLVSIAVALSVNTAALFKDLSELRELDKSQPDKALIFYNSRQAQYPNEPTQGLFEIHKIGFRAALIMNDHSTVASMANLFQSKVWEEQVRPELPFMISNFGIYFKRNSLNQLAENTFLCAKRLANDPKFLSTIDNNLAALYLETNQVDKAQKTLIYALKHHQGDEEDMQSIHANLGALYFLNREYNKAITQYKEPFLYFVRKSDIESAVHVGLNLLIATVEAKDLDTYQRFYHKVSEQVALRKSQELNQVLLWIQVYERYIRTNETPNSEIQSSLVTSMPLMAKMEIAEVIDRIVTTLNIDTLSTSWHSQPKYWLEVPSTTQEPTIEPIRLSWCESNESN